MFLVAACYTGPATDHYEEVLDKIVIPPGWELVKTERHGPGEESDCDPIWSVGCPGVRRWYLVESDALTALDQARQAVIAASYLIEDVQLPACDGQGPSLCMVIGRSGNDKLAASVGASAPEAGIDIAPSGHVVVVFGAQR